MTLIDLLQTIVATEATSRIDLSVSDYACDLLEGWIAAHPDARYRRDTRVYDHPGTPQRFSAIESVDVEIGGVTVTAQRRSRCATAAEVDALGSESAHDHRDEYRSARVTR